MKISKWVIILFLAPTVILFSLIFLAPICIVFFSSFTNWRGGMPMTFAGLDNYIAAFKDPNMIVALKNTLIWVLLQSIVHVGLGTTFAFILSSKMRGWKVFRTIYMVPNVISMAALAIIFSNLFAPDVGLVNSIISKIIGEPFTLNWYFNENTAFFTVTLSWLLYAGLINILVLGGIFSVSEEVIEAAKIDGATSWQINTKIVLPLIRTVLGTAVILSATSMLREFELIYLTTNGGPGNTTLNLPLYLYKTSLNDNNYGYANMMGVVLIGLGVIFVVLVNKMFRMDESDF